jgi:Rrf2 family transcriptional regulator, cysteine metabolism repressor
MHVSSKSRYALRALVELDLRTGGEPRPVCIADLASERDLPEQFLEQLFATLRRAGLLRSHRGVGGGFTFARRPDQVSVLDVVSALDGPLGVAACTEGECDLEDFCGAAVVWRQASEAFEGVLAATSVSDLAERERQLRAGQPMYQI